MLHYSLIEFILLSENAGLLIDVVTCDRASWNRVMGKLFGVTEEVVRNNHIADANRRLWFIWDLPDLLKCFRSFFTKHEMHGEIWAIEYICIYKFLQFIWFYFIFYILLIDRRWYGGFSGLVCSIRSGGYVFIGSPSQFQTSARISGTEVLPKKKRRFKISGNFNK